MIESITNNFSFKMESVKILNVIIDNISMVDALISIEHFIKESYKSHIVTINPEFIMQAQTNENFRNVLNNARLRLPDGIGIVLASKIIGKPIKERVTGVDTVYELARISALNGWRIFLLGAAPGVAEKAASELIKKFPTLQIAGTYAGSPHPDEEKEICDKINQTYSDILLVAYGSPNQDLWIARNLDKLNIKIAMGVGGTFDFIAGVAKRAPQWIRKIGLEWFYRLMREPYRWRRMLALPKFALKIIFSRLVNKKRELQFG